MTVGELYLKNIVLVKQKAQLIKALKYIYEECDWERAIDTVSGCEYGDNRIGDVCYKYITGMGGKLWD